MYNLGPLEAMRLLHFSGVPLHHPTPPAETDSLPRPPELPRRTELARRDNGTPARNGLSPGERLGFAALIGCVNPLLQLIDHLSGSPGLLQRVPRAVHPGRTGE